MKGIDMKTYTFDKALMVAAGIAPCRRCRSLNLQLGGAHSCAIAGDMDARERVPPALR